MDRIELLRSMLLVRAFETMLAGRKDRGFQLFSAGQEAVAVGLCAALLPEDRLLSSGRSIGPALARGLDPGEVLSELIGKATGPNRGKGGRGHLAQPSAGFFGAHAVVGGNLSVAAGVALAAQSLGGRGIVACLFGDGACGAGVFHETLNIAALWKLPLLLVCDNNQYSVSTPRTKALAPQLLSDFAQPFGIPRMTVDGMDVIAVRDAALAFADHARAGHGPAFLECLSQRFSSHSTATRDDRPATELARIKQLCPIERHASRLEAEGILDAAARRRLEDTIDEAVTEAVRFADAAPYPDRSDVLTDVV